MQAKVIGAKNHSPLLDTGKGGWPLQMDIYFTFKKENLYPAIRQKEGGRLVPPMSISQLPSAQSNPYAKVVYFWVAYPDPFKSILISSYSVTSYSHIVSTWLKIITVYANCNKQAHRAKKQRRERNQKLSKSRLRKLRANIFVIIVIAYWAVSHFNE